jgi:hypothetical protein
VLSLFVAVVFSIILQVGFVSSVFGVMLPHGGFKNKSFFQMPGYIQFLAIAIILLFHAFPIFISAVMYAALLMAVNKIQQEKENQIKEDKVLSGQDNQLFNPTQDHLSVQENAILDQISGNIESSVHNSASDDFRRIADHQEVPINTINSQITQNLQNIHTRVICIDSEIIQIEGGSSHSKHSSSAGSYTCNSNSNLSTGEKATSKGKSDSTITKKKKKEEIEKLAALRSMKTNLLTVFMFAAIGLFTIAPTMKWKLFLFILVESTLKCMMPIVTTLSNFKTIKKVAKMYFYLIKYQLPDISNN